MNPEKKLAAQRVESLSMNWLDLKKKGIININFCPISAEVYHHLLARYINPGDTVMNIAPGIAFDPTGTVNHLNVEVMRMCKEKGATLVVLDLSHENLLTHLDVKVLTESSDYQIVEGDALQIPIKDEAINAVVSSNFYNCPYERISLKEQAAAFVDEIWRILKPGGFIALTSFGYAIVGKDECGAPIFNDGIQESDIVTIEYLEGLLHQKGFKNIREIEVDHERLALSQQNFVHEGGLVAVKPK